MTSHTQPSITPDYGGKRRSFPSRSGLWLLLVVLSLGWAGLNPADRRDPPGTGSDAMTQARLVAYDNTCADGPVISLRRSDNATSAFFTVADALLHFNNADRPRYPLRLDQDFFDACGRPLYATHGLDGGLLDLLVASDKDQAETILERVRGRSQHVLVVLEFEDPFPPCQKCRHPVVTLANADIPFEEFAGQLAATLQPEGCDGLPVPCHNAGWWHNVFGH